MSRAHTVFSAAYRSAITAVAPLAWVPLINDVGLRPNRPGAPTRGDYYVLPCPDRIDVER